MGLRAVPTRTTRIRSPARTPPSASSRRYTLASARARGQHLDMALQESGAAFMVESIMDYRLNGRVARPRGNRSTRIAPQGAYRSLGTDCWLAIGVETDDQWRALCTVIERPDLADRFPTHEERLAAHDEIDAAIEGLVRDAQSQPRHRRCCRRPASRRGRCLRTGRLSATRTSTSAATSSTSCTRIPGTSAGTASRGGSRGPRRAFAGPPPASRSTTTRSSLNSGSAGRRSGVCATKR